jgi:hypothetical protein
VTTTGGVRTDRRRPDVDAAREADVALLRAALSGLADVSDLRGGATGVRVTRRPECRATRAALHDYLHRRLVPSRRTRVEIHLDRCSECTRSFIDVREASWALRGLGRRLVAEGHRGGRHRARRSAAGTART